MLDICRLLSELDSLPKTEQVVLQSSDVEHNKWWEHEEDYTKPIYDIPYINSLMERHGMLRSRVMRMKKKYCYFRHTDRFARVHIPLVTNKDNFFVLDDKVYYLPIGEVYLTDTTLYHTFVNASQEERIHIVGATLIKANKPVEVL